MVVDKTTGEILREMASIVFKENGFRSTTEEMEDLLENMKFNENVVFPLSTNEETFIYRICPAKVRVDTCFNHKWDNLPFKLEHAKEFDKDYNKSLDIMFLDMKDFKVKSRNKIRQEREDKWEEEHQKFLQEMEARKKYGNQT